MVGPNYKILDLISAKSVLIELEEGMEILGRLPRIGPNHPSIPFWHYFLANGYARRGDWSAAQEHARIAVDAHPAFCMAWFALANAGVLGLVSLRYFSGGVPTAYVFCLAETTPEIPVLQTAIGARPGPASHGAGVGRLRTRRRGSVGRAARASRRALAAVPSRLHDPEPKPPLLRIPHEREIEVARGGQ